MPITTVQKMIGAIIILISLMNASPSGFIALPYFGEKSQHHTDHDCRDDLEIERLVERASPPAPISKPPQY